MKTQASFSSKDKSKKLKCYLLQFLFGALRVRIIFVYNISACYVLYFLPFGVAGGMCIKISLLYTLRNI